MSTPKDTGESIRSPHGKGGNAAIYEYKHAASRVVGVGRPNFHSSNSPSPHPVDVKAITSGAKVAMDSRHGADMGRLLRSSRKAVRLEFIGHKDYARAAKRRLVFVGGRLAKSAFGIVHKSAAEEFAAARKARQAMAATRDPYIRAHRNADYVGAKAEGMYLRAKRITAKKKP